MHRPGDHCHSETAEMRAGNAASMTIGGTNQSASEDRPRTGMSLKWLRGAEKTRADKCKSAATVAIRRAQTNGRASELLRRSTEQTSLRELPFEFRDQGVCHTCAVRPVKSPQQDPYGRVFVPDRPAPDKNLRIGECIDANRRADIGQESLERPGRSNIAHLRPATSAPASLNAGCHRACYAF